MSATATALIILIAVLCGFLVGFIVGYSGRGIDRDDD